MPSPIRLDEPGSFHHVVNRGAAHRPIFEFENHVRKYLSLAARVARDGLIEIIAYALLTTHFHLYVRSVTGELSLAMERIEQPYSLWFNKTKGRDGSLFGRRFWSRRVFELPDERAVLDYVDRNPVKAGLVARASDYPWCSAYFRARRRLPPWLHPTDGRPRRRAPGGNPAADWLVEQRIAAGRRQRADDPLRHLIRAAPEHVRAWLRERERIADGDAREYPVAAPIAVAEAFDGLVPPPTPERDRAWARLGPIAPAHVALLRRLCGLAWSAIAATIGLSATGARDVAALHARRLETDERYATWVALVASRAVRSTLGDEDDGDRRADDETLRVLPASEFLRGEAC